MFTGTPRLTDPLWLADWLEIQALTSTSRVASSSDLLSYMRIQSVLDEQDEEEKEGKETQLNLEVFDELEHRSKAAGRAYPFRAKLPTIRCRTSDWQLYAPYVFCLLLSHVGADESQRVGPLYPARLFESLSTEAARRFIGGCAEQFGSPRPRLPSNFESAVNEICRKLCEGDGFDSHGESYSAQDDRLDIVAWRRPYPDQLPGQLVVFGQCAAGKDWRKKLPELRPDSFCDKWFARCLVSPIARAFFTPYRIELGERWRRVSVDGGILFDRCRIAYLVHRRDAFGQHIRWSRATLRYLSQ